MKRPGDREEVCRRDLEAKQRGRRDHAVMPNLNKKEKEKVRKGFM